MTTAKVSVLISAGAAITVLVLLRRRRRKRAVLKVGWCTRQEGPDEAFIETMREKNVELTMTSEPKALDPGTKVLICPTVDLFEQCLPLLKDLEGFILPYAGVPERMRSLLVEKQLVAGNCHHNAKSTAELALALVFAASKRLVTANDDLRRGDWRGRGIRIPGAPAEMPTIDQMILFGKNAVVVGYGYIGQRVATCLNSIGMHVSATSRRTSRKTLSGDILIYPASDLVKLLRSASVVVLCCPLNAETTNLMDEAKLAVMSKDSILVNIARGPVVNEKAIFTALRDGNIGVYASDVWWNYPSNWAHAGDCSPSTHYDFSTLPSDKILVSPHRGGAVAADETSQFARSAISSSLANAASFGVEHGLFTGDIKRVDLSAGY